MADYQAIHSEAYAAGKEAAAKAIPTPMVVQQHASPVDDSSPVVKQWYVPQGACGFAWVTVRPGNSPYANWLKKNGLGSKAYGGGVSVWISEYNQSIDLKEAHAQAYAEVLRKHGINAYAGSRLD